MIKTKQSLASLIKKNSTKREPNPRPPRDYGMNYCRVDSYTESSIYISRPRISYYFHISQMQDFFVKIHKNTHSKNVRFPLGDILK